jgi:hypothetical protein
MSSRCLHHRILLVVDSTHYSTIHAVSVLKKTSSYRTTAFWYVLYCTNTIENLVKASRVPCSWLPVQQNTLFMVPCTTKYLVHGCLYNKYHVHGCLYNKIPCSWLPVQQNTMFMVACTTKYHIHGCLCTTKYLVHGCLYNKIPCHS